MPRLVLQPAGCFAAGRRAASSPLATRDDAVCVICVICGRFEELAEDAKLTTPSGATFTVVKGWHVARARDLIVIQEPQRELSAAFIEVTAPTVEEAIAHAWKRWQPAFARAVRLTTRPPPTEGWDEIVQISCETGAEERRVVTGAARRKGKTYYVTLTG